MKKYNSQVRKDSINHSIEELDVSIAERQQAVSKYPDDGFMKLSLDTFLHQKNELKKELEKILR